VRYAFGVDLTHDLIELSGFNILQICEAEHVECYVNVHLSGRAELEVFRRAVGIVQ
jgi:hypothetical protein